MELETPSSHTVWQAYVILGSGSRSSKLKIPPQDLGKIPGVQFIDGLAM